MWACLCIESAGAEPGASCGAEPGSEHKPEEPWDPYSQPAPPLAPPRPAGAVPGWVQRNWGGMTIRMAPSPAA